MNSSLEVLKKLYKPYRFTILKNVLILNTTSGDFVVKKKNEKNIKELYSYLQSRNFTNFPSLIDDNRSDINVYEYIESVSMPLEQKALDLIDLVSKLHNKTTFYKTVTEDDFKSIYDNIKDNVLYLKQEYNELYEKIKKETYMSPSSYALIRNISKVFDSLEFVNSELDIWFSMVKSQTKKRVVLIHNHLALDHFIKNKEDYLVSWDNSRVDSPVMDLVNFYQNEYFNVDFGIIFKRYLEHVELTEDEKKLFFILISLPKKVDLSLNEFLNCESIRKTMDYLFLTEELVRPYYAVQKES